MQITQTQKEALMREALAEAQRGMDEGEAPIGCVLALGGDGPDAGPQVVAWGHNRVNALGRKTAHAEMVAFENAGSHNEEPPALPLDAENIILVSTLEPCVMCLGAAMEGGVSLVLFGLPAPADSGTQRVTPPQSPESRRPEIEGGILAAESRALFEVWLEKNKGTEQAKFARQLLSLTGQNSQG